MLDAMGAHLPEGVTYTRPDGGLFVWCTLPEKIELLPFVKEALANGVAVVPGTAFATDTPRYTEHSFRVTYATPTDEQLVRGVEILGEIIKKSL